MGELEKAFFSDFEGAALGAFKGAVFPEDIRNPSGGGAAGGESAAVSGLLLRKNRPETGKPP